MSERDDIDKALYGRRRGGRIRVSPPEERTKKRCVEAEYGIRIIEI